MDDDYRLDLQCWFGLSYSTFLTLPRVLMEAMPEQWQRDMARLLYEYNDAFTEWPEGWGSRVQLTVHGKLKSWPSWVLNYRYPDREQIARLRSTSTVKADETESHK